MPLTPNLTTLDRLSSATRDLARFSRSAAGLGSVLGGILCLASYLAHGLLRLTPTDRILLASFPFLWIATKELLRRHFYQRLGRIDEPPSASQRRWHLGLTLYIVAVSAGILVVVLPSAHTPAKLGYSAIVLLMPFLTWRYLRTTQEFIVGTFLICQAAVGLGGGHYPLGFSFTFTVVISSLAMILTGLVEHRRFLAARRTLRQLQSEFTTISFT